MVSNRDLFRYYPHVKHFPRLKASQIDPRLEPKYLQFYTHFDKIFISFQFRYSW